MAALSQLSIAKSETQPILVRTVNSELPTTESHSLLNLTELLDGEIAESETQPLVPKVNTELHATPSHSLPNLPELLDGGIGGSEVTFNPELSTTQSCDDEQGKENIVFVAHDEQKLCLLVEEAGNRGVLDSGCSKSVAGMNWISKYTQAISPDFSKQLAITPSSEIYQFGGGEKRKSKGSVSVPTLIGD